MLLTITLAQPPATDLGMADLGRYDQEAIAVMDLATLSIRRLVTYTPPDHLGNPPTWSPDGSTIAFDLQHWDATGKSLDGTLVATVPVEGGEVRRLTSFAPVPAPAHRLDEAAHGRT